jgi:hypothetical protein
MSDVAFLRETELALMNAPFEADGWKKAISMVASATGSGAAHLAAFGGPLLMSLDMFVGREADRIDDYFADSALCGAANWRINCIGEPMTIQHERHYDEVRALGGASLYDQAVREIDMEYGCQSTLFSDERNFLGLCLIRSRREGKTDDILFNRFKHLIQHVQRSVRVQLALDGEAAELMLGELSTMNCRTVLLDRHGCLTAISANAEPLFEAQGPARLDGLSFGLRHREENRQLHRAMGRLLAEHPDSPRVHQVRTGRCQRHPDGRWKLSIVRLPDSSSGLGFGPALAVSFHPVSSDPSNGGAGQALN